MCGILGYISKENINPDFIKGLNDTQIHRGPDDSGMWIKANYALAHRRLSIIDTSSCGRQPMSNEDKTIWLVFNGEVYNFQELKTDKLKRKHKFSSQTDCEIVIHLYEEYGIDSVKFIEGMFAFAILDLTKNQLYLCRDRVGIKPLYYAALNGDFVFSSELKPFYRIPGFSKEACKEAIVQYLALGYINAPLTIFSNVYKLPPAHYLNIELSNANKIPPAVKYWDIFNFAYGNYPLINNEGRAAGAIDELLSDIAKKYLISDVPIGIFLSGGIDSSLVASYAGYAAHGKLSAFTVAFKEKRYNELGFAQRVAQKFKMEHNVSYLQQPDLKNLPDPISLFDEPFGDSSSYPTYLISKAARGKVKTILSGDGGDELFAGYSRYSQCLLTEKFRNLPKIIFNSLTQLMPEYFFGYDFLSRLSEKFPQNYFNFVSYFQPYQLKKILSPALYEYYLQFRQDLVKRYLSRKDINPIRSFQVFDFEWYLPGDILTKLDRCSMSVGLETRVPLLDHRFVELSFRICDSLKYSHGKSKAILKKMLEQHFGKDFLKRPKKGFNIPQAQWLGQEFLNQKYTCLSNNFGEAIDVKYLNKLAEFHKKGKRDFSNCLWLVSVFENWAERLNR